MRNLCLALVTVMFSSCATAPVPSGSPGPTGINVECWAAFRSEYELVTTDGDPPTSDQIELAAGVIGARLTAADIAPFDVQATANGLVVQLPITVEPSDVRDFLIQRVGLIVFARIPEGTEAVQGEPLPPAAVPLLGRGALKSATYVSTGDGAPSIDIELTPDAALAFANFTAAHIGQQFAIALDGVVYSAPTIQARIGDGRMQITGGFDEDQGRYLADVLTVSVLPGALMETSFLSDDLSPWC